MLDFEAFLLGKGVDGCGRTLKDYMSFDDARWEQCHDHIQWAFPSRIMSAFNPNAPVVPADYVFDGCPDVQAAIKCLMFRYLQSLHIHPHFSGYEYVKPSVYDAHRNGWVHYRNHNLRRITRLIECLGIFGLKHEQQSFVEFLLYDFVIYYGHEIPASTIVYWVAAWENKQHLLPQS